MDVFVVSHTHWDREWYHGAGRFRQRLVALVDELLDAPPAERVPFLLDGQAVVLDDYLALRPEREPELRRALAERRLEAGPWYVLADELIPCGESLVRNLLAGRAGLRRLGAEPPAVLYSPDAFGHPAALPALATGFGLPVVLLWRGYGGRRWPPGDAVRWRAPDGRPVVLYHLPPDGYEFGSNLPVDASVAAARWRRVREVLEPRARLGLLLVQNGSDHLALQRGADAALEALAAAAGATVAVRRATLGTVAAEIERRAAAVELPTVQGELRDSYGYTWALQGTFGTRAHQKRRAARVARTLVRDVEPWLALAAPAAAGDAARRAALSAAWRTLLRCHPHDTLCGCSIDAVARAMNARLDSAAQQATGLRQEALATLLAHDPDEARGRRAEWRPLLVARNAAARPRGGVAEVELLTFVADEPVGPGSGAGSAPVRWASRWHVDDGRVLVQPLAERLARDRLESPRHYPDNDLVRRTRGVAWLPEVPALGLTTFALGELAPGAPLQPPVAVRAEAGVLENGELSLRVAGDGRVTLRAAGGRELHDLLGFESCGDVGDTYTPSLVGPTSRPRFLGARLVAAGPLRGIIELRYLLRLPAHRTRGAVSTRRARLRLRARLSLDAGAPFLRIAVRGDNDARDHRLRIVLRTGLAGADVHADAAFGPVLRRPLVVPPQDSGLEQPPPTAPLHRYVTLHGPSAGATVYADGLAEYEASADGAVAVTLLRAVGELSRSDLPERPGHAGWPVATPGAQCRGPFAAQLALLPHGPRDDATVALVERVADDVLLPLRATTLRSALRPPGSVPGVELRGEGLALSAVKRSEAGDGIVLRCVNLLDQPVPGAWRLPRAPRRVHLVRLDETPLQPMDAEGREVHFVAGPREIVTLLVR